MSQEPVLHDRLGALFPSAELSALADRERDKVGVLILQDRLCSQPIARACVRACARVDYHYHHHWITRKP